MQKGIASMEWGGGAKCVESNQSIKGTKALGILEIPHNLSKLRAPKGTMAIEGPNVSTMAIEGGWWMEEKEHHGWMEIWPQVYKCIFDTVYAWWLVLEAPLGST
jgi:hypothetical protein